MKKAAKPKKNNVGLADIPSQIVAIDSIAPHDQNYNVHGDAQIENLAQSVIDFIQRSDFDFNVVIFNPPFGK